MYYFNEIILCLQDSSNIFVILEISCEHKFSSRYLWHLLNFYATSQTTQTCTKMAPSVGNASHDHLLARKSNSRVICMLQFVANKNNINAIATPCLGEVTSKHCWIRCNPVFCVSQLKLLQSRVKIFLV